MTFHGFSWQFEDLEKKQRWEAGALAISERTVAWQNSKCFQNCYMRGQLLQDMRHGLLFLIYLYTTIYPISITYNIYPYHYIYIYVYIYT